MTHSATNRRRAVLLPIGLLMLSMAVFGWGLQYKLSLYQAKNSITHLAPEAKLLSQKERPAVAQALSHFSESVAWSLVFLLAPAFVLTKAATPFLRARNLDAGWPPLPLCSQAFSIRPPPTTFSLR